MNSRIRTGIAAAGLFAMLSAPAAAQVPLSARALGMGGAYVGLARGHETLFLNPANLGLPETPYWSFAFPQVAIGATLVGPELLDFNRIRNYDNLDDAERAEILSSVPDQGSEIGLDIKVPVLSLQIRRFGFGVAYGSVGEHTLGKDFVDLLFNGYDQNRVDYRVGNTAGRRATYLDFVAAYGHRVGPLSVGVAAHYIHGLSLVQSRLFEPRFDIANRDLAVDYVGVVADGGTGYGVDVGAALQPLPNLTISAAVANLFSQMEWSEDLNFRQVTFDRSDFDGNTSAFDLLREYERSEQRLDRTGASNSVLAVTERLYDKAYFPTTLRAGVAWQLPVSGTALSAAYHNNLTDGRLSGSWTSMLGVGVQQKVLFTTLRAGYATNLASGTEEGSLLSGGLSLGPLELGVARYSNGQFGGTDREGFIGSFGLNVRTRSTLK